MEIIQVQKERSSLIQFLVLIVIIFLGAVAYLSYREAAGYTIPSLAILSLLTCLYVLSKERMLTQQHTKLIHDLAVKNNQVVSLDEALQNEAKELESEKGRSSDLGNRLRELSGLYRAISAVNASTDASNTFDAVLTAALELVDANCGSLMLIDSSGQHLVIAAHEGLDDSIANRTAQPIGDGIAGWVAKNGEALLLNGDVAGSEQFNNLVERPNEIGLAMSIPLEWQGRVTGVLNISSTEMPRRQFDSTHFRMAKIFAQHSSVAIQNVRLQGLVEERSLVSA